MDYSHTLLAAHVAQRTDLLRSLDALRQLPDTELCLLAEHAVLRVFEPHTTIMRERSSANHVYLLLDGLAEQSLRAAHDTPIRLAMLECGAVFGEGGLFGQPQRRTTVRSHTRVRVLQWRYDLLHTHHTHIAHTFSTLEQIYREHLVYTTLAQVPQLAPLDADDRAAIAQQVRERRFERGEEIVRAGTQRSCVYIVAEGQARVVFADQTVAVLNPGAVLGEMSFVDDVPHEATIIALTPVHALEIPRASFEQLLMEHTLVMEQLRVLTEERRASDRLQAHIAITEQLVATGIVRGTMVLAKNTAACEPGCTQCEAACADRFGVARLDFNGLTIGAWDVPDLCRHCQWGAECAASCPEDAFSVMENGTLVINNRCTGCGACLDACPYAAINQVPVYPQASTIFEHMKFALQRPAPIGFKANKCDACHGHADHACVSACPSGALQWIPVEALYIV